LLTAYNLLTLKRLPVCTVVG